MSHMVASTFNDPYRASEVLAAIARMQHPDLADLEDAVVGSIGGDGRIRIGRTSDLAGGGDAFSGTGWGTLIGVVFFLPIVRDLDPSTLGGRAWQRDQLGIDDPFVRGVSADLTPGSSAISASIRRAATGRVLTELRRFRGALHCTSLDCRAEARLHAAAERAKRTFA